MSFRLDFQNLFLLISIIANSYLFLIVYFNGAKNLARIFFMGVIIGVIGWAFGWFMFRGSSDPAFAVLWAKFFYVIAGTIPLSLLLFSAAFGGRKIAADKWLYSFTIAVGVFFIIFPVLDKDFIARVEINPRGENSMIFNSNLFTWGIYLIAYFLTGFYILIKKFRAAEGIFRVQLKYIIMGCAASALIGVNTNHFFYFFNNQTDYSWIGPSSTVILVAAVTYAITNYKLMGIRFFIRRSLVAIAAVFTIVLSWLFLYFFISKYTPDFFAVNLLFIVFTPAIFTHLKKIYYVFANKFLFASLYDAQSLVTEINDRLWRINSTEDIGNILKRVFEEVFHINNFALIEISWIDNSPAVLFNHGFCLDDEILFRDADLTRLFAGKLTEPVVAEEFVHKNYLSLREEAAVDWFESVKPAIVSPLLSDGAVCGIMLLGPKASGDIFWREDLQVIREISKSVSLAVGIAKRNEEKDEKVRKERRFKVGLEMDKKHV